MNAKQQERQQQWKDFVLERKDELLDCIDSIGTNDGVQLSAANPMILDRLVDLLCQKPFLPHRQKNFENEFANTVHAAVAKLCLQQVGAILTIDEVKDMFQRNAGQSLKRRTRVT